MYLHLYHLSIGIYIINHVCSLMAFKTVSWEILFEIRKNRNNQNFLHLNVHDVILTPVETSKFTKSNIPKIMSGDFNLSLVTVSTRCYQHATCRIKFHLNFNLNSHVSLYFSYQFDYNAILHIYRDSCAYLKKNQYFQKSFLFIIVFKLFIKFENWSNIYGTV